MSAHPYINRVDQPPDPCFVCGQRFTGFRETPDGRVPTDRSVFVQLRVQGGDVVQPGALISQREEPGRTVRMHRDPSSGQATPVFEVHPQVCGECIAAMAREIGFADAAESERRAGEAVARAVQAEKRAEGLEAEVAELREGARAAGALSRLLEAERPRRRATAKEAA